MACRSFSHPCKQTLFVLLSLTDLMLTCVLLDRDEGCIVEANPAARWWLLQAGSIGLAGFKASMVLVVLGLVAVIAHRHPRKAGRVLVVGCTTLAVVVIYSTALFATNGNWFVDAKESERKSQEEFRLCCDDSRREAELLYAPFQVCLHEMSEDVIAGRRTLREAAQVLGKTKRAADPAYLRMLGETTCPGGTAEECLATVILIHSATSRCESFEAARQIAIRLENEFQLAFGRPVSKRHHEMLLAIARFRENARPNTRYAVATVN